MPSRAELELRARVVGVTPSLYVNDSVLEQRVIYNEKNQATVTGTLASGTLTSDASVNVDGETVTIGTKVYTFKATLTEVAATNTLTSSNVQVSNNDSVTIGTQTYIFKTTIAKPGDVLIGADADASLTNLRSALNGTGTAGTDYATGTPASLFVSCSAVSSHVLTFTALSVGTAGNRITLAAVAATLTVGADFFSGGVEPVANEVLIDADAATSLDNLKLAINAGTGAGTKYSRGTIVHPQVTAGTNTDTTQLVTAIKAASGTSIATTETGAHLSWGATTLSSNVQAVIAAPTGAVPAQSGGALV